MAELLRKYPILWVPYVVADLIAIGLWRLRGLAERSIFHWFTTSQSVLGGEVVSPQYDSAMLAKASLTYAPIGIITIVCVIWLFLAALVATALIVASIEAGQQPNAKEILAKVAAG